MATLTNTKIKDTYVGLLKTTDNQAIDASGVTLVEDGAGNASALSVGRSGNGVTVTGDLALNGGQISLFLSDGLTQVGKFYDDSGFVVEGKANNNLILRTKANSSGEGIKFQDSSSNDLMFIDGLNGRVGIGTSSPAEKIDVNGSIKLTGYSKFYYLTNHYGSIWANSEGLNIDTIANRNMIFKKAGSEIMRIALSGNVGIGTSSPAATIHVNSGGENDVATFESTDATARVIIKDNTAQTDLLHAGHNFTIAVDPDNTGIDSSFLLTMDGTEKLRMHPQYLRLASGTGGIQFNGDIAADNALDDYEEGTFTPEVADAETGGNVAASGSYNAHYTKIGRQVTVVMQNSNIDTTGMTSGNDLWIRNLPFQSGGLSGSPLWIGATRVSAITASANSLGFQTVMAENASAVRIFEMIDSANSQAILVSTINSGASDIWITLTYFV